MEDSDKKKTNNIISVIIPVYNNKEDIIKAIDSVFEQTYEDWQLIIVDDNSNDGTYELIKMYVNNCNHKNKITVLKNNRNMGPFVCMNRGLINSDGEFICRLDSDDFMDKNKLFEQVSILKEYSQFIACQTFYTRIDTKKKKLGEVTLLYRRSVIDKMGYYDNVRFGADSEFIDRIKKIYGHFSICYITKILYYAKSRNNSLTTSPLTGLTNIGYDIRQKYIRQYKIWHSNPNNKLYIDFDEINIEKDFENFIKKRKFPVPFEILLGENI